MSVETLKIGLSLARWFDNGATTAYEAALDAGLGIGLTSWVVCQRSVRRVAMDDPTRVSTTQQRKIIAFNNRVGVVRA